MVDENHRVEGKNRDDGNFRKEVVLTCTKNENSQRRQDIFHNEETNISMIDEEVHEGIDFLGSPLHKEDRKVGIENREQYKQEKRDEETVAIAVNIQIGLPICTSANRLATSREHVATEGFRWPLAAVLQSSSISVRSSTICLRRTLKPEKPFKLH